MTPTSTQHSALSTHPSALAAVGGVMLVGFLVFGLMWAWDRPESVGGYNVGRAAGLLGERRYTEATDLLERTLPNHPSVRARLLLSEAYLGLRDPQRAETQVRAALQIAGRHQRSGAWTQLGRALAASGKPDEALQAWARAREEGAPYATDPQVSPHIRAAIWRTAMLHWQRGDTATALPHLESLLDKQDPYTTAAHLRLAQLYASTNPPLSQQHLTNIPPTPHSALRTPHSDAVPSGEEVGRLADALRAAHDEAEQSRKQGAGEGVLATLWGTAYLQQGEFGLARQQLEQAIILEPESAPARTRLGLALIALGDQNGALQQLNNAVRLAPYDPLAHRALAGIFMAGQEWARADEELSAFERLQPIGVEPHLARAEYHQLRGEYSQAEAEYEEAVTLQRGGLAGPNAPDASLAAARFYVEVRGEACRKGLPHAQYSLQRRPDDPQALDMVGWALVTCGEPEAGLSPLQRAVEQAPLSPRYRYHLARAYSALGRRDEALLHLTRVADLDPNGPWARLAATERVRMDE